MPTTDKIDQVIVPISKSKTIRFMILCLACALTCLWLWKNPLVPHHNPIFVEFVSALGFLLCSVSGLFGLRKLFDTSPGLIVDAIGIVDNASGISAGRILWADIVGINITGQGRTRFLTVEVSNPAVYIHRASLWKRWLVALNGRHPVQIPTIILQIDFDELIKIINRFRYQYGLIGQTKAIDVAASN